MVLEHCRREPSDPMPARRLLGLGGKRPGQHAKGEGHDERFGLNHLVSRAS
jgi:hypothetical protein